MPFNIVDLVIAIALLIGLANGYRRGFWLSFFQYVGMVVGVVVLTQVPTPLELAGIALVVLGVAVHRDPEAAPVPVRSERLPS